MKNVILGIVFLAAGLALAAWGFMNLSSAMHSQSWPTAEGKITSSKVVKKVERYTDSNKHRKTRIIYRSQIRYRYAVDGRAFTGSRITMADSGSSSKKRAQKICARYPSGSICTVFYDPATPGESVLKAGITFGTIMFPGMGILFAVIGVAIPILGRKSAHSRS